MFLLERGGILQIGQTPYIKGSGSQQGLSLSRSCWIIENVRDNPIQTAPATFGHGGEQHSHTHTRGVVHVVMRYVVLHSNKVP